MKEELQNKLYQKYPKLFRQKDLSMSQSCMCFGIECGSGWFNLIDELCGKIQDYIDKNNLPQVECAQCKSKFAGLRFYVDSANETVYNLIDEAEKESYKTCENCGSKENVKQVGAWITALCGKCRAK